ncbi:DoxX family membrane protein [Palleronia pelagia]|uniref:DoxX protein n=1 Tax=Palleronia pelagia TaxID=387096 RepID=A0A1H8JXS0_9RHOB|nr:DoxX family membrane protein [Palleronia pelagia]SEN85519.1 DoxX protein [Palleronia pelagia]
MLRAVAFVSAVFIGLIGTPAAPHVRWFVDGETTPPESYALTDPMFLLAGALALTLVAASVWLDPRLPAPPIPRSKWRHDVMELLRVFTGMSFLLTAYEGALVAPHHAVGGPMGIVLLILQTGIGILLIANRWIFAAAALMLVLLAGVGLKFGILAALEYAMIAGIAMFLMLNFNRIEDRRISEELKAYSVDALRIWTGVSLVSLAVGEKLAPSALGQAFVQQYEWNFMTLMGIGFFDDKLFVLSAGMVEAAIGIVLILGTTTRLAVLALSVMMALSNVVFILQDNNEAAMVEFIGHMPIIGTAMVLLVLGYGRRLTISRLFERTPPKEMPQPAE